MKAATPIATTSIAIMIVIFPNVKLCLYFLIIIDWILSLILLFCFLMLIHKNTLLVLWWWYGNAEIIWAIPQQVLDHIDKQKNFNLFFISGWLNLNCYILQNIYIQPLFLFGCIQNCRLGTGLRFYCRWGNCMVVNHSADSNANIYDFNL